ISDVRYVVDGWDSAKPEPTGDENFDDYADLVSNGSGGWDISAWRMFGTGFNEPIASITSAGAVTWYASDRQGSIDAIFDTSGTVIEQRVFDPFGNLVSGGMTDRYGFQGGQTDIATALTHFGARWYDPSMQQWTSEDPLGLQPGPNQRAFVENGPTNATDPSGEDDRDSVSVKRGGLVRYYPSGSGWNYYELERVGWTSPDGTRWVVHDGVQIKLSTLEELASHYSSGEHVKFGDPAQKEFLRDVFWPAAIREAQTIGYVPVGPDYSKSFVDKWAESDYRFPTWLGRRVEDLSFGTIYSFDRVVLEPVKMGGDLIRATEYAVDAQLLGTNLIYDSDEVPQFRSKVARRAPWPGATADEYNNWAKQSYREQLGEPALILVTSKAGGTVISTVAPRLSRGIFGRPASRIAPAAASPYAHLRPGWSKHIDSVVDDLVASGRPKTVVLGEGGQGKIRSFVNREPNKMTEFLEMRPNSLDYTAQAKAGTLTPAMEAETLDFNLLMIERLQQRGFTFKVIGVDSSAAAKSSWLKAELEVLERLGTKWEVIPPTRVDEVLKLPKWR